MPRVFVDPNAFSADWFPNVLEELVNSSKVTFLFSNCEKGLNEVERVRKARAFMQLMVKARRAIQADREKVEAKKAELERHPEFVGCASCDDGHIFA
ncbi:MAG: hypothetical protein V2I74_12730, partial [Erythrobacter sp.]|nr:hypothetical protein [Erythrobacter sp.]